MKYVYRCMRMTLSSMAVGSTFTLKFRPTAGFTYTFGTTLTSGSAAHLRYAIYPEQAISSAGSATAAAGNLEENNCDLGPEFAEHQNDVGEVKLGTFGAAGGGRDSWGEKYCKAGDASCCDDASRVGPAEAPDDACDGGYRHFPGESFGDSDDWEWTCPLTGQYVPGLRRPGGHECF